LAPDADHKIYLPTSNGSKLFQITTVGGVITSLDLAPNPGKELNMKQENLAMGPNETKVNPDMIEGEKPEIDKEIDTEKITMQEDVKSMMDAMSAEIKQLRDDIANIYSKMEGKSEEEDMEKVKMEAESFNEESKVKDILKGGVGVGGQGKPNDGGPSKYNMSAQKKFTGAPAAEAKPLEGLFKSNKVENAMSRVFSKMANSKI
jgi:gas vesicle protein